MNQTKTVILFILILVVIFIVGGFYLWQKDKVANVVQEAYKSNITKTSIEDNLIKSGPISYSITDVSASVSTTTEPFGFTADKLKSTAEQDCGTQHELNYFNKLIAKFNGATRIVYNFKYEGTSQDAGIYTVMLLPNKAGYTSINQFRNDFNLCYAGGDTYPLMLNSDWLLFVSACGTGYDDGSGRPHGCDEVRKIVEPSLKLNY